MGWIRETLEGSMFLLTYGLIAPDAPEATWILKDYEDNLYISDVYGYAIPNFDEFWFSRGGFSMQANLLEGPVPYLYRDEIKHFLRAYFNGFASAFYPGTMMLNEHSKPELGYPAGDHFKTSDEANVTGWLRLMFVREDGKTLYLGQGIPRYWLAAGQPLRIARAATHFGPMSLEISLEAGGRRIKAVLTPPERNPPEKIYLRLRHPEGKPIERVTRQRQALRAVRRREGVGRTARQARRRAGDRGRVRRGEGVVTRLSHRWGIPRARRSCPARRRGAAFANL